MGRGFRKVLAATGSLAAILLCAAPASAHAFGIRYDLPIPLGLYLVGGGAAVLLSFIVMARFLGHSGTKQVGEAWRFDLLGVAWLRWLGGAFVLAALRSLAVAVFGSLLWAGFFGNEDPFSNIAPTFIWVVWWVGMAFVCALFGNLWALVNPWNILFNLFERAWRNRTGMTLGPAVAYPAWLGRWPVVGLFLLFAWLELIFEQSEQPRTLAMLIVAYSAVTWFGMVLFGRQTWLGHGEIFNAVFGLLSRFAPTTGATVGTMGEAPAGARAGAQWFLRPPAVGLISQTPASVSTICFVLLLLTTVTFDGILETPMWAGILNNIAESQALRGSLIALQNAGMDLIVLIKTMALIALPCVFIAVFLLFSHGIAMFGSGGRVPTWDVAGYFVLSLVPIAIAYHLSHYLSYLLLAGQYLIPLASDPFGLGWDLFGTVGYRIDIGIINAKMVWYIAVSAIVVGHVFAVYIAHVMALWVFEDRGAALRSQIPMLVLMIGYTMISLWILSQPIVN
ncbi:MAG: hypothetical protein HOE98_23530 [Rhodospirillaceae bacterium]|jgi:hypothetical protein|nr:hypothetical protein [Rhodospirillaceae bacterium]MBT3492070.1 hypothetical protein [Rhodospirillaceae bacterium]MBT3781625.1 hypothetical protein [Rhodospirillaceae bacterium]MBT3979435.1 hypothetical protein [Rhodospirillaceae bacterium]MBT4564172.1 hypothetical protein [Rhodospirillaceae bacterium]